MPELTDKQKATNYETILHIRQVQANLNKIITQLLERGRIHDKSKLEEPELEFFVEHTDKLKGLTYGTEEYTKNLEVIAPALDHHYAKNRHHPQHWKDGINDMNIIDVIEMFCDWAASTKRTKSGNLRKSLDTNAKRFNMGKQLRCILENSIDVMDGVE